MPTMQTSQSMTQKLANPTRFMHLSGRLMPWLALASAAIIAYAMYLVFFVAPPDYQQGQTVKIMYIHVPAAWMALFCYTSMAAAAAAGLIWKHPLADMAARATAPIGAGFTLLALVTGSLWGKPMWGTWWVWDARLTSVLVLFFLYLGYIALVNAFDDPGRGVKASSILALVGFVNVPIIKFSVDWWNTLHQPASVIKMGGPAIHPSMLAPLLLMVFGFTTYYLWLLLVRMRSEFAALRLRAHRHRQAGG